MEYAQHAAHKLKFKKIIIQTSPMVVLENIKGPTQWLKVTKIFHSKSDLSFSFVTLVSYAIMCYTLDTVDFTLLIYILDKWLQFVLSCLITMYTQIAKFMGPTWGPPGSCRPQMGPMNLAWTLALMVDSITNNEWSLWYGTWLMVLYLDLWDYSGSRIHEIRHLFFHLIPQK